MNRTRTPKIFNFLPGPITVHASVLRALEYPPISHRDTAFLPLYHYLKELLLNTFNGYFVEVMMGSGTLANDLIAAQLSKLGGTGLILTQGEFGDRLIDHAKRFKLPFKVQRQAPGETYCLAAIEQHCQKYPTRWLWTVHCETSTGVLNDLSPLKKLAQEYNLFFCLDAISSMGTTPVDLAGVDLASGVSGKGLGSLAGLALVFYATQTDPCEQLPRYLDLGFYQKKAGIPFTLSSQLVQALCAGLERMNKINKIQTTPQLARVLRNKLQMQGWQLLAAEAHASPSILTIVLPANLDAKTIGDDLKNQNIWAHYQNPYLLRQNWLQISLMNEISPQGIDALLQALSTHAPSKKQNTPQLELT